MAWAMGSNHEEIQVKPAWRRPAESRTHHSSGFAALCRDAATIT
jgi:hypothetical protein